MHLDIKMLATGETYFLIYYLRHAGDGVVLALASLYLPLQMVHSSTAPGRQQYLDNIEVNTFYQLQVHRTYLLHRNSCDANTSFENYPNLAKRSEGYKSNKFLTSGIQKKCK